MSESPSDEKKRFVIRQLSLDEVSMVDDGANPGARVVLWKRREEESEKVTDKNTQTEELAVLAKRSDKLVAELQKLGHEVVVEGENVVVKRAPEPEYVELDGQRVLKSSVPAPLLSMLQKQAEDIRKLREERETETLRKSAETLFGDLPGKSEDHTELMRAVTKIADSETQSRVLEVLKSASKSMSRLTKEIGSGSNPEDDASPKSQLEKMAKEYAAKNGTTYHQAYAEVVKHGEGRRLAAQIMTANRSN